MVHIQKTDTLQHTDINILKRTIQLLPAARSSVQKTDWLMLGYKTIQILIQPCVQQCIGDEPAWTCLGIIDLLRFYQYATELWGESFEGWLCVRVGEVYCDNNKPI